MNGEVVSAIKKGKIFNDKSQHLEVNCYFHWGFLIFILFSFFSANLEEEMGGVQNSAVTGTAPASW